MRRARSKRNSPPLAERVEGRDAVLPALEAERPHAHPVRTSRSPFSQIFTKCIDHVDRRARPDVRQDDVPLDVTGAPRAW